MTVKAMPDYKKIRNKHIRTAICKLLTEMLETPDETGIYATSKFMFKMEDFCLQLRYKAMGYTWAKACTLLDQNKDPRQYDQARLISDADKDLDERVL